jgi:hypothetical protein
MEQPATSAPRLTEAELAAIALNSGGHSSPDEGHCLLEVVSMFAGEQFGDKPQCVDPVLRALAAAEDVA